MTHVAPRIVNNVSGVQRINDECYFSLQHVAPRSPKSPNTAPATKSDTCTKKFAEKMHFHCACHEK